MNRLCWLLTEVVSKALRPGEREVVLGDLAECGESAPAALLEILSLFVRRQAAPWQDWRPWLALFGVAGIAAFPMSEFSSTVIGSIARQISTYRHFGVHLENGVTFGEDVAYLSCLLIALLVWLWISGFVLGSLSGSATWFNGTLFWFAVSNSFWLRLILSGNIIISHPNHLVLAVATHLFLSPAVLTLPVAAFGMRQGVKHRVMNLPNTLALVLAIAGLTGLLVWMQGWYEAAIQSMSEVQMSWPPWYSKALPFVIVSWPVWYMLAVSSRVIRRSSNEQ